MSELRLAGPDTRTLKEILDSINEVAVTLDYMPCRAIQEDIAEIANRFAAGSWISVDDALPEEFENVIVANKRGKIFDIDKAWWNGSGFARCGKPNYYKVTHWMPLPKPPEVKET